MTLRIFQVPSPKQSRGRGGYPVIAIVHHRMVGTLAGTDITFTTGTRQASTNFGVGYDCGKAGHPTGRAGAHVHQYVPLGDVWAWGNGNIDASGDWDDWYGLTPNPNWRTVSIEHHDNGGATAGSGKGVVVEEVLAVSIALDRLLLSGDLAAWKATGITVTNDAEGAVIAAQLRAIAPGPRTLIDHHAIAGKLKPSCWRPWADDPIGFPQARYITELTAGGGSAVDQFIAFAKPQEAVIPTGTWLYVHESLDADPANVQISPGRTMPVAGKTKGGIVIVGYVDSTPTESTLPTYFLKAGTYTLRPVATATDCTAQVKAATDSLNATISAQKSTIAGLVEDLAAANAEAKAATASEKERIAQAAGASEATRIRGL